VSTWVVVVIVVILLGLVVWALVTMIHVMQEYERGVVFRLGRVLGRP
jgi:regulator of protease activity HflC (stomatin/prohibitin superfamily)